ncbi:hypothetical protein OTK49_02805 [Vibrio coralliirubri]|uniref:hypothetical protein n=1 Tax=Vibrio coralliirubri TaxID=1516159 RepID=UPI002284E03F|nr:hypothetical protein [Vibrio coralliirubri]MCY9861448.1 hypothetical protein [Vibrio coralliirubri]
MVVSIESKGTPAAEWRINGEKDPFGDVYECGQIDLALGRESNEALSSRLRNLWSEGMMMIGVTLAVKDRIRWLSRNLTKIESDELREANNVSRKELLMGDMTDDHMANAVFNSAGEFNSEALLYQKAGADRLDWLSATFDGLIRGSKLIHGAIYELDLSYQGNAEGRCNISSDGDEVWFTDRNGREVVGNAVKLLRVTDNSFSNNDI